MSQSVSLEYSLPELSQALIAAGQDLFGFAMALWAQEDRARKEISDTLLLALERGYIVREVELGGAVSHQEFRAEIFTILYGRARDATAFGALPKTGIPFYALKLSERAAVFLKTRTKFSWPTIAQILDTTEGESRAMVERAREALLGRRPFVIEEEIF